jgi:4-alpha-glucanotransferase
VSDEATRAALEGLLVHLGRGPADLVLVDLEDCWLEEQPINRPGVVSAENWRRRSARTNCEIGNDPRVAGILAAVDQARAQR